MRESLPTANIDGCCPECMHSSLTFYARMLGSYNYILMTIAFRNVMKVLLSSGNIDGWCTECMYLRLASIIGILLSHAGQWKLSAANISFNWSVVFAVCLVRYSSSPLGNSSLSHSGQEWACNMKKTMTSYQANIVFWAMEIHISNLSSHNTTKVKKSKHKNIIIIVGKIKAKYMCILTWSIVIKVSYNRSNK